MSDEPVSLPEFCQACEHRFELLSKPDRTLYRCPFCQQEVWPNPATDRLTSIAGFEDIQPWDRSGPTIIYSARENGRRYLICLLDCGAMAYRSMAFQRDQAKVPQISLPPLQVPWNDTIVRWHPPRWDGRVCILSVDFFEGHPLYQLLNDNRQLSVEDAMMVLLSCLDASKALATPYDPGIFSTSDIWINPNGQVRLTSYLEYHWWQNLLSSGGMSFQPDTAHRKMLLNQMTSCSIRYKAPETVRDLRPYTQLSPVEICRQQIFALGMLTVNLLRDQPPSESPVESRKERFDVPSDTSLRMLVPPSLYRILKRMLDADPTRRYDSYDPLIQDLQDLEIASDAILLEPPDHSEQKLEEMKLDLDLQWVLREPNCDFRAMRWGMTHQEVLATESLAGKLQGNGPIIKTMFRQQELALNYSCIPIDGQLICVSANLLHVRSQKTRPTDFFSREHEDLIREGKYDEADQLLEQHAQHLPAAMTRDPEKLVESMIAQWKKNRPRQQSQESNKAFALLSELISLDFGVPRLVPPEECLDLEYLEMLSKQEGLPLEDYINRCRTAVWEDDRTAVCLAIHPMMMDADTVAANFVSRQHSELFGGQHYPGLA